MISPDVEAAEFFVAGGTLRPGSPSYVKRAADDELFQLALTGEFCYVLTARQMGKSSLMIHTARRLMAEGVQSVVIDLTKIGIEVSSEQWYLGLLTQLKRKLRLSVDLEAWWQTHATLGNVQRFTDFLRDVLLEEIKEQVVIFVDEIDTTLNLPFSDDFFAAIRFVYNARATNPEYTRLTFVLLGVGTPADLIKDRRRTPFNIGQGIDLTDFTREDAGVLQDGLKTAFPNEADVIFDRIFYWTHGHPYLTQKLCLSAAETSHGAWTDEEVDHLVERLFLSKEARKETNLQFVRDSVENSSHRGKLLSLYRNVYEGKMIPEVERSLDQNRLKLFGLVRAEDNCLHVRNEIYRRVFNKDWIRENTPVDWSKYIITGLIILVFALVGVLIYWQWQQQRVQQAETLIADFRNATSANERIVSLAGLFDNNFGDRAGILFGELNTDERLALFRQAQPETVGTQLTTVVQKLYANLENNERDNLLLKSMADAITTVNEARARKLQLEITFWLKGRELFNETNYAQALEFYNLALEQNDRNPGIYFDRGSTYAAQHNAAAALADFNQVLELDTGETRQTRVSQTIIGNALLYDAVIANPDKNQILVALVPSPTGTPTATTTPTSTPTFTPTPTDTPIPTPSPTKRTFTPTTEASLSEAASPTDTPIPSPTSTPTATPSPTPRPATLVYVQSNRTTHNIGLVGSNSELLNAQLHTLASAPAWSPDGTEVAFYGEPGISRLGGIYAEGAGVWIINVQTDTARLLYQVDHVKNINWSPDATKLAFEFGPPGVTAQIIILDVGGGQEVNRFAGEQPTWSPDSSQLVIKSCQPECGLWLMGIEGSSIRLLINNSTASYPDWSPDGAYIVYTSRGDIGDWEIYRLDFDTSDIVRLTNQPGTDTTPVFSPDGIEIYWRTDAHGSWQIRKMALDGSNDRPVIDDLGPSDDWGLARPAVK